MPARLLVLTFSLWLLAGASAAAEPYRAPRGADGRPDLEGVWSNATWTPLQRSKGFADLTPTDAEEATWVADVKDRLAGKPPKLKPGDPPPEPDVGESEGPTYEGAVELMRIDGRKRASIIVEPIDGRLPYNAIGRHAAADALKRDETAMEGPEDRQSDERCLAFGSVMGPPMLPAPYNSRYQIVQTPGLIAIHAEMIHDLRLIRMGGAHEAGPPKWAGDSIGRWEGETLVVETVNQHPLNADRFVGPQVLHLTPATRIVERFTRTSPTEIRYAFEVEDASIFTRPWRGEMVLRADVQPMYEYACHEGNYALANILGGARREEREKAKAKAAAPVAPKPDAPAPAG